MSVLVLFRKSYVKAHQRRLKSGQVITIPAHYDKRTKKGADAPLAHGHDLSHLDEAKRATFEKMHAEQHLLHHYHAHALRQRVQEQQGHIEGLAKQVAEHRAAGRHVEAAKTENQRLRLHSRHRVNQRELDDIEQRLAGLAGMKEALVQGSGAIDASTEDSHRAYTAKLGERFKAQAKPEEKPAAKPQEYRYALRNRPFGIGTAPKDGWVRTEPRPAEGADHHGLARHGFAVYSRPLTDKETSSFELTPIVTVDEHAQRLVAEMGEYAQQYAEPENAELLAEYVTQNARDVGVASTDDMTALQQRVLAQIGKPFTPTHELPDGTPVRATGEKGVYTDASGAEIEDDYAKPIKAAVAPKQQHEASKDGPNSPAKSATTGTTGSQARDQAPAGGAVSFDALKGQYSAGAIAALDRRAQENHWQADFATNLTQGLASLPQEIRDYFDYQAAMGNDVLIKHIASLDEIPGEFRESYRNAAAMTVNGMRIEFIEDRFPSINSLRHELVHYAWANLYGSDQRPGAGRAVVDEVLADVAADGEKILKWATSKATTKNAYEQIEADSLTKKLRRFTRDQKAGKDISSILKSSVELELMVGGYTDAAKAVLPTADAEGQYATVAVYMAIAKRLGVTMSGEFAKEEGVAYRCGEDEATAKKVFGSVAQANERRLIEKNEPKINTVVPELSDLSYQVSKLQRGINFYTDPEGSQQKQAEIRAIQEGPLKKLHAQYADALRAYADQHPGWYDTSGERPWLRQTKEEAPKPVTTPKSEATGPQEGDTKSENGIDYVLKDGRWHRVDEEIVTDIASAEVGGALIDRKAIKEVVLNQLKPRYASGPHEISAGNGDPVSVSWAGIRHALNAGLPTWQEAAAALHIEALINQAELKEIQPDKAGRADPKSTTLYGVSVRFDEVDHDVTIFVRNHSDGNRYYDHVTIEKKNPAGLTGSEGKTEAASEPTPALPFAGSNQSIAGAPGKSNGADDLDPSSPNYRYRDTGYVGGSRKELAAAMLRTAKRDGRQVRKNDIDWETLETNPREAKEVITKSHLFGTVDWEGLKAQGLTPGAGFVMDRVYASVGTGPRDDTPQARQDYALGLETLRNRLEVCRTPEEIEKTLAELKEERDGVNLNSEESARFQELEKQAEAAYAPVQAYKMQEYELDKAVTIAHRVFYAAESPAGHRRGGKYTADQQADIDKARAGLESAQQAKQALVDAHPEMQEETATVHTAKGSMTTWTRPAEKEWRRIRQQQDVLVAAAKARNQVESPMLRAWSQLGERFNAVLDYRSGRGSDTFHNHLATAKLGRIKDWSWQKTTQTGTKAPRQVTQEGRRFQLQVADSHERVGGRSVPVASTADLKERFGLREVQSGNWVLRDPVSAKFHTEQTAGALADLADILGITDQQVAMNGRVALAFGARGTGATSNGAARAHYETVSRIINLTKMGGGGCLAHEWLHALDNLLLETQGGTAGSEDFLTRHPSLLPPGPLRNAFQGLQDALKTGQHRIQQRLIYTPEHYRQAQQNIARTHMPEAMREYGLPNAARLIKEARDASVALDKLDLLYEPLIARGQRGAKKHLADWRNVALAYHGGQPEGGSLVVETGKPQSSFAMEAVKLDLGAAGKYWSRTEELAARAFQSYVEDKLTSQGRRNDYLSAKADNKYYRMDGTAPFPEGEERTRINAAFDKLIAAMQADNSLAKALARTPYPRRLVVFRKSYIHGHYRKNPKTGEMVWVESYSDKRTTKQGQTLFAHDLHRQDHFKQNLAEGRLREAMHSFHDLDHDAAHKLAGTLGLHNGDKHADKKELMRAVRGKVLQQQQDYQAQVKMQEDKAKGKGPATKPAVKPETKPEVTPAPPTAEMDMHAVMDSAEKHLGTESTFEIFDHLPQRTGDDPRWSKAEMYRAIMAIQKERKADKHGKAKHALLEANGGSPLGIEAKKPDSNRHALILPDASNPGKYRYSAYDEHGFYTHATHDTADQALDEAIKEGFTEHAPGSLDRLSQTDTWAQGMKRAEEAQAGWKAPAKAPESPPEAPAAKTPSQSTPAASSPAQPDPEDQVLDINGAEVPYAWKLVDAEDLAPTSEKADNQFRDRTRAASDEQVASMAANLKFRLLSDSPLMDYGAPVLAQDGKTIIGGNGRSLAIRRAYGMGQADGYQKDLTKRAARFGIDPAAVAKMKAPVLVRVLQQDVDIKQAAIASNEGGGARMSALEQARVDGERLGDLSDFEADEEGDFNNRANLPFIRRFLGTMPVAQRSAFQAADGGLSQEGISRLRNAVLYRAYGDSDVLSRLVESADPAQRNVLSALTRAAPTVAQASADVKAGNLHDLDVSADIVAATTLLAQVRGEGKFGSVDEYLNQQNLFGDPLSDATKIILKHFDRNLRSSKAMAGFLTDYYAAVRQIGDPKQMGMFADATPDKPTLLRQTDAQRQNAPSPQAALF